jgi:MoaA/NifB/PqqE/SkfB family radical SAM enzyme
LKEIYINFNFEVLKGCHLKCEGCFVNKEGASPLTSDDLNKSLTLMEDLKETNHNLHILFVGPTDFLISQNTLDILREPKFQKLISYFEKVSLQTTFLDFRNAPLIAGDLKEILKDKKIEINIILEPNKLENEQYLKTIYERKMLFNSMLKRTDIESYGIMNIFDYSEINNQQFNSYLKMHEVAEKVIKTGIDFNLSLSRSTDMTKELFQKYAKSIQNLHNSITEITAPSPKRDQKEERQYNFSTGSFYYSPLFYERVGIFSPSFRIEKEYISAKGLTIFEKKMKEKQSTLINKQDNCAACEYSSICTQRGVIYLMDYLNSPACYMPKKNPHFLFQMGTLPIGLNNEN